MFIFNFLCFCLFYYAVKDIFFFFVGGACNQSADAFAPHAVARAALVAIFCFCTVGDGQRMFTILLIASIFVTALTLFPL